MPSGNYKSMVCRESRMASLRLAYFQFAEILLMFRSVSLSDTGDAFGAPLNYWWGTNNNPLLNIQAQTFQFTPLSANTVQPPPEASSPMLVDPIPSTPPPSPNPVEDSPLPPSQSPPPLSPSPTHSPEPPAFTTLPFEFTPPALTPEKETPPTPQPPAEQVEQSVGEDAILSPPGQDTDDGSSSTLAITVGE